MGRKASQGEKELLAAALDNREFCVWYQPQVDIDVYKRQLFHYQDAFYREYGAVTRKRCGKGSIYYLGCGLEEELLRQVMAEIWEEQGICCCLLYTSRGV